MALARQDRADARRSPRRSRAGAARSTTRTPTPSTSTRDGDFLMSARNTWAIYKIDRETGAILLAAGRQAEHFKLGRGPLRVAARRPPAHRRGDHAVRQLGVPADPQVLAGARAAARRAGEDGVDRRARVHPRRLLAATQGNQQSLPNGGALVGWGSQRYLTEFDPGGDVVFNARLSLGFESYRAYRLPWVGLPRTSPPSPRRRARRRHGRLRELERRHRGRALGDPRRPARPRPADGRLRAATGFETRSGCRRCRASSPHARRTPPGACSPPRVRRGCAKGARAAARLA